LYTFKKSDFEADKQNIDENEGSLLNLDLEGFSGPLDLLLQLAQQKKLDITKISILSLVDQYITFIKQTKKLNLNLASDYLVMAAILAYIKSKLLLPSDSDDNKNEKETLPELLAFNLKRLKAMRETSESLFSRDLLNLHRFLKGQILDQAIVLETEFYCNKNSLLICFSNIFNRKGIKNITLKTRKYYNIENAIEKIKNFYKSFKDWFALTETLPEAGEVGKEKKSFKIAFITTVSASLELAKRGEIYIKQSEECGEIFLKRK
tara:strand:+ start:800 stop:1591 length:792 start_codon:yes stop_codon:yes gene_type:complete